MPLYEVAVLKKKKIKNALDEVEVTEELVQTPEFVMAKSEEIVKQKALLGLGIQLQEDEQFEVLVRPF